MPDIWFSSDHHLGHKNTITFENDGKPLRPFSSIEEHDETIIQAHNSVVKPGDKVYFLGDFCMDRRLKDVGGAWRLRRFNGHKRLVRGNHDLLSASDYLTIGFEEIYGIRIFTESEVGCMFACTHVPVHPDSLGRWKKNVHGHLHAHRVKCPDGTLDERYKSVCIEHLDNYRPVHIDEIIGWCKNEQR